MKFLSHVSGFGLPNLVVKRHLTAPNLQAGMRAGPFSQRRQSLPRINFMLRSMRASPHAVLSRSSGSSPPKAGAKSHPNSWSVRSAGSRTTWCDQIKALQEEIWPLQETIDRNSPSGSCWPAYNLITKQGHPSSRGFDSVLVWWDVLPARWTQALQDLRASNVLLFCCICIWSVRRYNLPERDRGWCFDPPYPTMCQGGRREEKLFRSRRDNPRLYVVCHNCSYLPRRAWRQICGSPLRSPGVRLNAARIRR